MRVLVLGGTIFLGRHLVEQAMRRGHAVTLFHRGRHGADLFPDVERVLGDRDGGLARLGDRRFDAVVDTCGYVPRIVDASAAYLHDRVRRYVFVSTLSVYADASARGADESAPVATLADRTTETIDGETYGPLKALCEQAVESHLPGRSLVIRPGLIVGPHDPSDRFTYWPVRVARGGEVLVPEGPDVPVQWIDVRDLAAWSLDALEAGRTGVFNAIGPPCGIGDVVEACRRVSGSDARFCWVDRERLAAEGVAPWSDLPLWVPDTPENAGFSRVSASKAVAAGLSFRSLDDTVRDTLAWASTRPDDHVWRAGLDAERERAVLARSRGRAP